MHLYVIFMWHGAVESELGPHTSQFEQKLVMSLGDSS